MSKSEQKRIRYQKTGKLDDPIREAAEAVKAADEKRIWTAGGERLTTDEIENIIRAKLEAAVPAPLLASSEWEDGYNEALAVCRKAFLGGE